MRLLYGELADWYRLLDPTDDHLDEAEEYREVFEAAASTAPQTLLELGAGGGNNAFHLKRRFRCTLTDISPQMLALSRTLNPECEHALGDMRSLRLNRRFDLVLVHDAVAYMTTDDELRDAAETAFVHTNPGGAAIFAPDHVADTFRESSQLIQGQDGRRALRGIEWAWDPDPADTTYIVEYSFLLRDQGRVRAVHDRHVEGLFSEVRWHEVLGSSGYLVETVSRRVSDDYADRMFVCRRPSVTSI